jgi:hypothetical protein
MAKILKTGLMTQELLDEFGIQMRARGYVLAIPLEQVELELAGYHVMANAFRRWDGSVGFNVISFGEWTKEREQQLHDRYGYTPGSND